MLDCVFAVSSCVFAKILPNSDWLKIGGEKTRQLLFSFKSIYIRLKMCFLNKPRILSKCSLNQRK